MANGSARCLRSVVHIPCSGSSITRQATISLYGCEHEGELPVYIETARLRLHCLAPTDVSTGDTFQLDEKNFIVKYFRHYPSARRTVVDLVRAGLDPCNAESFAVYRYETQHGCNAGETPEYVTEVKASLFHALHDTKHIHDSRQWVGRYRAYLEREDARQLSNLSVLVGSSQTLKVVGVYDLQRAGRLPFAVVEESNINLPVQ